MREPFLKLFKVEYYQITQEVTAATAVCGLLSHSVVKEVIRSLSPRIVTY